MLRIDGARGPVLGEEMRHQRNDRNDEHKMNQPSRDVERHEPGQPKNEPTMPEKTKNYRRHNNDTIMVSPRSLLWEPDVVQAARR
jgi:hypothetical protein